MSQGSFYNVIVTDVRKGQTLPIPAGTLDFLLINQGDTAVQVNGIFLKGYPPGHPELIGSTFSPDANLDEEFIRQGLFIVFADTPAADIFLQVIFRVRVKSWP